MARFLMRSALPAAALCLFSQLSSAAPGLTTIQDVLYKADGSPFTGVLQITWTSFQAADTSNIPTQSVTTQITNGFLHVLLVPTTNAATPAVYNVVYNSNGNIQFTETWAVPPSTIPLRVSDVRISQVSGSAAALSQIQIGDVSGLRTELNIRPTIGAGYAPSRAAVIDTNGGITGAAGNLADCVHVDGTSGACAAAATGSYSFADAETPTGSINGANATFTLANAPSPAASLKIFRNGLLLEQTVDFTVSAATIVFQSASVPQPGDNLEAFYRTGTPATSFTDAETPSGTINGLNTAFTLAAAPSPANSLELYRNGLAMQSSVDFTLSGSTITFQPASVPQPGDVLQAFYRTGQ